MTIRQLLSALLTLTSIFVGSNARAALTLDSGFDTDGIAVADFGGNLDAARGVAVQSDGKPVLAGMSRVGSLSSSLDYLALTRLNTDGSIDTSFGTNGRVTTLGGSPATFGGSDARAVAIDPANGNIVVVGSYNQNDGSGNVILVARYSSLGVLDANFGTGGIAKFTLPITINSTVRQVGGRGNAVAILADGRIVVAGQLEPSAEFMRAFVMRVNANGTLDTGFAANGAYVNFNTTPVSNYIFSQLRLQTDGKIVAAGTNSDFLLVRLSASGALDNTFSGDGIVSINFETGTLQGVTVTSTEEVLDFAIRTDGSLVATGRFAHVTPSTVVDVAVIRLTSTGELDTSFGNGTIQGAHLFTRSGSAPYALTLADDESIVITGLSMPVYQISPNGTTRLQGPNTSAQAILRLVKDSNGRIIGAGEANISGSDYQFTALRLGATALTDGPPPDTTPDTFTFVDQTNVARAATIVSAAVTVAGINAAAPVSIIGGEYSIGCSGTFTSAAGNITNGQTICVRHTSAAAGSASVNTVVTIGGVSDTFASTTIADDSTPDAFSFTDQTNVATGSVITSNAVTIAGINIATAISITGGEYSIGCGSTFASAAGTINSGQTVCVRHTASSAASTAVNTVLTVGSVSDTFTSTTAAPPPPPPSNGGGGSMDIMVLAGLVLLFLVGYPSSMRKIQRKQAIYSPASAALLITLLLAPLSASANESICASIQSLAKMAPQGFASLETNADGKTELMLTGASECSVEEPGEFSCTWQKVKDPAKQAAKLGHEIATCFVGSTLQSLDLLGMHIVKTETATITVLGAMADNLILVTIK